MALLAKLKALHKVFGLVEKLEIVTGNTGAMVKIGNTQSYDFNDFLAEGST
jgi:hypothetical protein